jgi:hypothetical protein
MPLITLAVPYSVSSPMHWLHGWAERSGEGGGSGVPWEVKVVGADIKWLVGPSGLGWYFRRELDDMSKGRREKCLGDDGLVVVLAVLGELRRSKFHRYRSGLARCDDCIDRPGREIRKSPPMAICCEHRACFLLSSRHSISALLALEANYYSPISA